MHRFDTAEDDAIFDLIDRSQGNIYPLPEVHEVEFQRFGLQLREEDLEPKGTTYSGFKVRDRSQQRKSLSGKSVFTNTKEKFKIELDVWPFKMEELDVMYKPGSYIVIKGTHDERHEDGSYCTRNFTRYYILPKSVSSKSESCTYGNFILALSINKLGVEIKERGVIPITPAIYEENDGVAEKHLPLPPSEIEGVPVSDEDREDGSVPIEIESEKEDIVTSGDSTNKNVALEQLEAELSKLDLDEEVRKKLEFTKKYLSGSIVTQIDDEANLKDIESTIETTVAENTDVKKTVSDVMEDVKQALDSDDKELLANGK